MQAHHYLSFWKDIFSFWKPQLRPPLGLRCEGPVLSIPVVPLMLKIRDSSPCLEVVCVCGGGADLTAPDSRVLFKQVFPQLASQPLPRPSRSAHLLIFKNSLKRSKQNSWQRN